MNDEFRCCVQLAQSFLAPSLFATRNSISQRGYVNVFDIVLLDNSKEFSALFTCHTGAEYCYAKDDLQMSHGGFELEFQSHPTRKAWKGCLHLSHGPAH